MAEFGNPDVIQEEVDILMIGGGMACCGTAYELGPWMDAAKKEGVDIKVKLVDKAAMDRSGAVAQGLSAINTYIGSEQDPADYARMVSNDLMGITVMIWHTTSVVMLTSLYTCSRSGACPSGNSTRTVSVLTAPKV